MCFSVLRVLPTRPLVTRASPTHLRSTCATTLTTFPTVRSSLRVWWGSSAPLHMSSHPMPWLVGSSPSQGSPSLVTRLLTSCASTTTPGSTTAGTTASSTPRPSPASTTRTSSSSPSLLEDPRVSAHSENRNPHLPLILPCLPDLFIYLFHCFWLLILLSKHPINYSTNLVDDVINNILKIHSYMT